jgi:hypothetical protein
MKKCTAEGVKRGGSARQPSRWYTRSKRPLVQFPQPKASFEVHKTVSLSPEMAAGSSRCTELKNEQRDSGDKFLL